MLTTKNTNRFESGIFLVVLLDYECFVYSLVWLIIDK